MSIDSVSQARGLRELILTSSILENFTTKIEGYLKENEADADYQSYQASYTNAILKARSHFAEIAQMALVEVDTVYNNILQG